MVGPPAALAARALRCACLAQPASQPLRCRCHMPCVGPPLPPSRHRRLLRPSGCAQDERPGPRQLLPLSISLLAAADGRLPAGAAGRRGRGGQGGGQAQAYSPALPGAVGWPAWRRGGTLLHTCGRRVGRTRTQAGARLPRCTPAAGCLVPPPGRSKRDSAARCRPAGIRRCLAGGRGQLEPLAGLHHSRQLAHDGRGCGRGGRRGIGGGVLPHLPRGG